MDVIAEHPIDVLYPDGSMCQVHLRIGRPRPHPGGGGDWGCVVQAEGLRLWEGPSELFGEGSLQALMIGARFLQQMLSTEVARGAVLRWHDGTEVLHVDDLFVLPKAGNASPAES